MMVKPILRPLIPVKFKNGIFLILSISRFVNVDFLKSSEIGFPSLYCTSIFGILVEIS